MNTFFLNSFLKRCVALVILVALLFSLTLSVTSCVVNDPETPTEDNTPDTPDTPATILSKQEIRDNMDFHNMLRVYDYAYEYLSSWGISNFNSDLFAWVENKVAVYYVEVLPSAYDMAVMTCEHFLTNKYDSTDLTDNQQVTNALMASYVASMGDEYAIYRSPEEYEEYSTDMSGSFVGIGVTIEYSYTNNTLLVVGVLRDSAAELAGIKAGDYIYAVDGVTLEEAGYDATVNAIRGELDTEVTVTVIRDGEQMDFVATRKLVVEISVAYGIYDNNIGYIAISSFKRNTAEQFKEAVDYLVSEGVEGIVFDLRNNLGGYLSSVVEVVEYLVPFGTEIVSYQYRGEPMYQFTAYDPHSITVPCTVICNKYTASAAEIFTSALRDYDDMGIMDVTIVGTTTYGKGIVQNTYNYTDKSSITFTIAYYNPPSGVNFHNVGIEPDVTVAATDIQTDVAFNVAVEELLKLIAAEADSVN